MTAYSYSIHKRQTKTKGTAFDLYVKINKVRYRPVLGYDLSDGEAQRRAAGMIETILRNLNPPTVAEPVQGSPTLGDVLGIYWDTMALQKRVDLERPRLILQKYLVPYFGNIALTALKPQEGLAYVKFRKGQGAAEATILREFNLLLRLLNLAVDYDLLDKNRLKVIKLPKPPGRERVITGDEFDALETSLDPDLFRVVQVALHTGLRQSMILAIEDTWLSPQEDGWWLLIPKARTKLKGTPPKIPLNAVALNALTPPGRELVTGRIFSRWTTRNGFTTVWAKSLAKTGLTNLHFHDLRHSFVTRLQNHDVSLEVRSWLAGHKLKGTTINYSHGGLGWDKKLRAAVETLVPLTQAAKPSHIQG